MLAPRVRWKAYEVREVDAAIAAFQAGTLQQQQIIAALHAGELSHRSHASILSCFSRRLARYCR